MEISKKESDAQYLFKRAQDLIDEAREMLDDLPYQYFLGFSVGFEEYSLMHTYALGGPKGKYKSGATIASKEGGERIYYRTLKSAESALAYYSSRCNGSICGGHWDKAPLLKVLREKK